MGDYMIVSQDTDFLDLSLVFGAPPKLILLRIGNSSTAAVEAGLRSRLKDIERFADDELESCLVVSR